MSRLRRLGTRARTLANFVRRRPVFSGFNVTERCNLSCSFCTVWRRPAPDLPLPEVKRVLEGLRRLGVGVVGITGGEPFLRRDILDILKLAADVGLETTLVTNGTTMTPALLKGLRDVPGLLQVAVSVDSLRREVYAHLRGRDELPRVTRTFEALAGEGLRALVKVNTCLSRVNHAETGDLLAYASRHGGYLTVFPLALGRDLHHRAPGEGLVPTPAEREAMQRAFLDLAARKRAGARLLELPAYYERAAAYVMGEDLGPCDAGRLIVDVRADGSLAPCLDQPPFGHLLDPARAPADPAAVEALRVAAEPAIRRCARETPCCYTCTTNLSTRPRGAGRSRGRPGGSAPAGRRG